MNATCINVDITWSDAAPMLSVNTALFKWNVITSQTEEVKMVYDNTQKGEKTEVKVRKKFKGTLQKLKPQPESSFAPLFFVCSSR